MKMEFHSVTHVISQKLKQINKRIYIYCSYIQIWVLTFFYVIFLIQMSACLIKMILVYGTQMYLTIIGSIIPRLHKKQRWCTPHHANDLLVSFLPLTSFSKKLTVPIQHSEFYQIVQDIIIHLIGMFFILWMNRQLPSQ